jgi:hypothetical protein
LKSSNCTGSTRSQSEALATIRFRRQLPALMHAMRTYSLLCRFAKNLG